MEEELNNLWMLPLKDIALRRVVAILSNRAASLSESAAENEVESNIIKLNLPPVLTTQMIPLVKPIGSKIKHWKKFHEENFQQICINTFCNVKALRWTNLGTINYRKTAEKLISMEGLDMVTRYRLACLYCLDDYIPGLWKQLPEKSKNYFYKNEGPLSDTNLAPLECCWPFIVKNEEKFLNKNVERSIKYKTFNQYAFEYSAMKGNKAATVYFYRKLTCNEKANVLVKVALLIVISSEITSISSISFQKYSGDGFPLDERYDVFCYLLSVMSPEQRMEVFKKRSCNILLCFLEWPWQNLFLDIAQILLQFLTKFDFVIVLLSIYGKIKSGHNMNKLFQDFFLSSTSVQRGHFVKQECEFGSLFRDFFAVKDEETIKIIFRNIDDADRTRLIFSEPMFRLFHLYSSRRNYDLVNLCLQEATLAEEEQLKFMEEFNHPYSAIRAGIASNCSEEELFFHYLM